MNKILEEIEKLNLRLEKKQTEKVRCENAINRISHKIEINRKKLEKFLENSENSKNKNETNSQKVEENSKNIDIFENHKNVNISKKVEEIPIKTEKTSIFKTLISDSIEGA